jgi:hypothetical protein
MKVLYILQNAYRSDKYNFRNREEWHEDLFCSHTGRRLSEMIPEGFDYYVVNSSPNIGSHADSKFPPSKEHIIEWYEKVKPDIVVACGKIAQQGCKDAGLEHIKAPHPAWRALSKKITNDIKLRIKNGIKS